MSSDGSNAKTTERQVREPAADATAPERPADTPAPGRQTVALVIPLFNEEEMVPALIDAIEEFRADHPEITQIVLVDDGSRDDTSKRIRRRTEGLDGYLHLRFSRNFGHQLAVTAGLRVADADAAVIMDADLQDPLPVVAEMIEHWRGGYDVVYGIRTNRKGESVFKRATAAVFYRFFRWMTDLEMPVDAGDFRLVSRRVIDAYNEISEQEPFVRGLIAWLGFNQKGIRYERAPRRSGRTKYSLRKMMRLATRSLTSFSDKPLRFAIRLGLLTAGLSFAGLLWVILVKYAFDAAITGWASITFMGFFFGGMQLFFLGMVGTYIARVYEEVKARPRYVIEDRWESGAAGHPSKQAEGRPKREAPQERGSVRDREVA